MQLALESLAVMMPEAADGGGVVDAIAAGAGSVVVVAVAAGAGSVVVVAVAAGAGSVVVVAGDGSVIMVVPGAFTLRVAGSVIAEPAGFEKTAWNSSPFWETDATNE
jgi:hypothetical protein